MESSGAVVSIDMPPYDKDGAGQPPPYSGAWGAAGGLGTLEPPRDFVLWSFFNTVFCNPCCLGFLALVFSIKARDRKVLGDINGADSYGKTARNLNIAVLILSIIVIIVVIVLVTNPIYHH
ncbi:dispanin subfamily A member 2b [Alligator mississippiensis]|uniref:Dispanin subfamily A member 2b-like n=1 Tax=Alligator mississippiensis TaxID=8496 RepID=A0A151NXJ7_ALLMI|nr:dispanin subfamily A member 2b [Alligator mississippiensis]KYO41602.1 dispanin subfamily A member 2b-like [Alligator mississippiensis]